MTPSSTSLCEAIKDSKADLVEELLDQGADVNERDAAGNVPLLYASNRSLEIARLLLDKGADINAKSGDGATPLNFCIVRSASSVYPASFTGILRLLVKRGADLDYVDYSGRTPLQLAKALNHPEAAKIIKNALRRKRRQSKIAERGRLTELHNTAATRQKALKKLRAQPAIRKNMP